MAPKRRPPKKGKRRMDAALDAMDLYGFPRKLVRATVQSLLKVYGGNEGWVFIEDSGYTLLIDTLLEKQANPSPQDCLIEANPGNGPNEGTPAGCSNSALRQRCTVQTSDDTPLTNQTMDTAFAATETGSQLSIKGVDTVPTASETGSQLFIKGVDTVPTATEIGYALPFKSVKMSSVNTGPANELVIKAATTIAEIKSDCQPAGNLALRENHGPVSLQLGTRLNHKRRRPCYGWISDDEEDEEDLIDMRTKMI